jgi:hypothetical protein
MINLSEKYFLMIEPDQTHEPTTEPVEDELTQIVDEIFALSSPATTHSYRGVHFTKCGKTSDNKDWLLPNGMITHSLITYYIRHYRHAIPESEIEKIKKVYKELK